MGVPVRSFAPGVACRAFPRAVMTGKLNEHRAVAAGYAMEPGAADGRRR